MKKVNNPEIARCGDCTFCCEWLPFSGDYEFYDVWEDSKDYDVHYPGHGEPCNKLCDTGCSIHPNKPTICSFYQCSYISQELDDKYRPDKNGLCGWVSHMGDDLFYTVIRDADKNLFEYYYENRELQVWLNDVFEKLGKRMNVLLSGPYNQSRILFISQQIKD